LSPAAQDLVAAGELALSQGAWDRACEGFEAALAHEASPEGFDGLARALWWLDRPAEAIDARVRAYALFRRAGDVARAVRIALWLVHEYSAVHGNEPAAEGWLARAEHLLTDQANVPERGYLDLAKAERCLDPAVAAGHAEAALALARRLNDPDLELPRYPGWDLAKKARHRRGDRLRLGGAEHHGAVAPALGVAEHGRLVQLLAVRAPAVRLAAAAALHHDRPADHPRDAARACISHHPHPPICARCACR